MPKPITITGRVDLIAAIYDEDNLPSAIIVPKEAQTNPYCLHSLREGNEGTLEALYERAMHGLPVEAEPVFLLYRFFEDFPKQDYKCAGCHYNRANIDDDVTVHLIADSNDFATKLCEDCA